MKLLVFSDVHDNEAVFDGLLETARREAPDYICLVGDTLDEADCETASLVEWIGKLARLAPVVIGLGNHEIFTCDGLFTRGEPFENRDFYEAVEKIENCVLLKDEFAVWEADKGVVFSALNMPDSWYQAREDRAEFRRTVKRLAADEAMKGISAGRFQVMLSHSPNGWLHRGKLLERQEFRILDKVDLILCGHNHGGLVPLAMRPFLKNHGFVGPNVKIFQPHAYGYWTDGQTSLILSDGVTKFAETSGLAKVGRALNRLYVPDVESITIVPGEQYELVQER